MKLLALILASVSACSSWTHDDTLTLRHLAVGVTTGGAQLVVTPLVDGDRPSNARITASAIGVALGVLAITGSFYVDPPQKDCP